MKTLILISKEKNSELSYNGIKNAIIEEIGKMFLERDDHNIENAMLFHKCITDEEKQHLANMCETIYDTNYEVSLTFIHTSDTFEANKNYLSATMDELQ